MYDRCTGFATSPPFCAACFQSNILAQWPGYQGAAEACAVELRVTGLGNDDLKDSMQASRKRRVSLDRGQGGGLLALLCHGCRLQYGFHSA